MQFHGHLRGAFLAAGVSAGVALASGYARPDSGALAEFLTDPLAPGDVRTLAGVAATAWFMALFPDLDVASVPQRWFLRGMFALLVVCFVAGRMELFAVLAFAALLPLLHQHRGWSHHPTAPFAISFLLALVHEWLRSRSAWMLGFSWDNIAAVLTGYWMYVLAAVLGHYTHLALDVRLPRLFGGRRRKR
ncbi:MAG: hypothetical protein OEZ59_00800 [Deltaproteobacteria bacterium]|nr:hypothetical protein [Deltaproteobacteria bacterium]